jgi:hypothetical protein
MSSRILCNSDVLVRSTRNFLLREFQIFRSWRFVFSLRQQFQIPKRVPYDVIQLGVPAESTSAAGSAVCQHRFWEATGGKRRNARVAIIFIVTGVVVGMPEKSGRTTPGLEQVAF